MRAVLVLVIACVCLAACNVSGTAGATTASDEQRSSGTPVVAPSPSPSPAPTPYSPPPPTPYTVAANERYPRAKQLAVDAAQTLTTYEPDTTFRSLVAKVARGRDRHRTTQTAAEPLCA